MVKYFSHDFDARNDPKIMRLRYTYNVEGYGLYFAIVEQLYGQESHKLPYDDDFSLALQYELRPSFEVKPFLDKCVELGLFQTDGKTIWSDSISKRVEIAESKSEARRNAANARWNKHATRQAMPTEINGDLDISANNTDWARVVSAWESNGFGMIPNPQTMVGSSLDSYYAEMGADVLIYAISISNVKNATYLLKMLKGWSEKGVKSVEDAKAAIESFNTAYKQRNTTTQVNPLDGAKWY